jgi:hypothetical protein
MPYVYVTFVTFLKYLKERDQYREKLSNAKESISKVEVIVESKVKMA